MGVLDFVNRNGSHSAREVTQDQFYDPIQPIEENLRTPPRELRSRTGLQPVGFHLILVKIANRSVGAVQWRARV